MHRVDNVLLWISHFFRLVLVVAIIWAAIDKFWVTVFVSSLTLLLTFVPAIVERNYKITLPLEFEFMIVFFIFGTIYLGELGNYYEKYAYWDIILHTLSGVILGTVGFLFVYILNKDNKINLHLSAIYVAIFSFSFAVSFGVIWEIFEYAMDSFFGLNMQKSGLDDTMWDLIVDSLGALLVSFGGYFYVKKVKVPIFYNMIEKFMNRKK